MWASDFMAGSPVSTSSSEQVTDEAAFWCMRLHDESCSDEERKAFEHWLRHDPKHAAEYQAMLEIWTVSENLHRQKVLLGEHIQTHRTGRPRGRLSLAVAASLLFAGLLGWAVGLLPHSYHRYRAQHELLKVSLTDGSTVQLNRGTLLSFLNFRDRREVVLNEGEAFFNVQHDAAHPFVVKAGDGRIVVTGTAFNVWKYEDQVTVTLQQGSVKVIGGNGVDTVHLSPGHQARYAGENAFPQVTVADPAEVLAWREGKLVIDDLSLADALPLINRYLEKSVRLADPATSELRIGGIFNTDDMPGLVMRLPKVLPVHLEQDDRGDIVIKRRGADAPN